MGLASNLARAHGLDGPIAATNRFSFSEADEAVWQEAAVTKSRPREWVKLEWTDELDVVGPFAGDVLERHGVALPFNSHFHEPLLAVAAGGSLLTGIGGDELFARTSRYWAARFLHGGRRPGLRDLPGIALALSPHSLRRRLEGQRLLRDFFAEIPWLTADASRDLARAAAAWFTAEPMRYDEALLQWAWPSRYMQGGLAVKEAMATRHDVLVLHPFSDSRVMRAAASTFGWRGPRDRGLEIADLLPDLLPPALASRDSKASFDAAFLTERARAFASGWSGGGVDTALVDVERLRATWLSPSRDAHSLTLMQAAWLHERRRTNQSSST